MIFFTLAIFTHVVKMLLSNNIFSIAKTMGIIIMCLRKWTPDPSSYVCFPSLYFFFDMRYELDFRNTFRWEKELLLCAAITIQNRKKEYFNIYNRWNYGRRSSYFFHSIDIIPCSHKINKINCLENNFSV